VKTKEEGQDMNRFFQWLLASAVLAMAALPAFAQDIPDTAATDQSEDQAPPSANDTGATPTPTDPTTVIAQWGPAPNIGPDADRAVAQRWFRDQNTLRGYWGVPIAARDPYLDWEAENLLRSRLGQPLLPQSQAVNKPPAALRSPQTDQAILSQPEFWTVSDDLWLAWLDAGRMPAIAFWEDSHPGEKWYTPDGYFRIEVWRQERFDRYRLMGIAGRVNTSGSAPTELPPGNKRELEQVAPGSVAAYQPMVYPDNLVAVVGYDPWINPDGSLRQ
jgi:hypothetical protein